MLLVVIRDARKIFEAEPDGPGVVPPMVRLLARTRRYAGKNRHFVRPWYIVNADDKNLPRLNCFSHLLRPIPYREINAKNYTFQSGKRRTDTSSPKAAATTELLKCFASRQVMVLGRAYHCPIGLKKGGRRCLD